MSILSRIKKASLWAKVTSLYSKGKFAEVTELMQRSIENRPLGIYEQILYAGALAGKGESSSAANIYSSCIERAGELSSHDSSYVAAYCRFMIAKIECDQKQAEKIQSLIKKMSPPTRIQHFVNHDNVNNW